LDLVLKLAKNGWETSLPMVAPKRTWRMPVVASIIPFNETSGQLQWLLVRLL